MSLKIESLQEQEINLVLSMMKDFYEIDNYAFDEKLTEENFKIFIKNETLGQAFLLKDEENVVGYVILNYIFSFEFGGTMCFLDELYITPEAQGKKYGGLAVEFAQKFAKEKGLKMMFLEVEHHNERAVHLYKKLGFEMHKRNIMTFKP